MNKNTLGIISANYVTDELDSLIDRRAVATIPFGGRYRLIDFALSNMVNSGIKTVGLIAPVYYRSIMDHIESGKPWGLARKVGGLYLLPGTPFGETNNTGACLLRDLISNHRIVEHDEDYVLFTDTSNIMNCDFKSYIQAHEESGNVATVLYTKAKGKKNRTYFKLDKNGLVKEMNKEEGKDGDALCLNTVIMNRQFVLDILKWYVNVDSMDIFDVLQQEIGKQKIGSYEMTGYVAVVDTINDYKKASMDLLNEKVSNELFLGERQIYTKISDEAPTMYKTTAKVSKSIIAAGCIVEGTVENSIIFRNCHIKKGAVIKNSIVISNGVIGANAKVSNAIVDKNVVISDKTVLEGTSAYPIVIKKDMKI